MKLFKPYFSEWLVRQYFRGWWLLALLLLAIIYYIAWSGKA